ncbi:unnamed protein product [Didymodactylos carnosus]|uniref:Uncharacterized protein n=1 Tax=Didymodactylos carnosus TaxID=1234261 RepID=A0A815FRV6_9BILA|nr:unnamed protein product [Didymodactylos carnosus]CAF1508832.1 unnamed protein product [Didymodactylos carnosus]CAF4182400.1 unnamed protein product [Didymodactylos carnosus]CAF4296830.1 unnamed protein product [Didymodactylos carnosus]
MDATAFQAQRAAYFRKLDELRAAHYILYYHDETWLKKYEEKTFIWFDDEGYGPEHAEAYFKHVKKHEQAFQTADKLVEEMETDLVDDDDEGAKESGEENEEE